VQLLPELPGEGEPFSQFYLKRLGNAEAVHMRQSQVQQAAAGAGLAIDLSSIATMPNTADAHRLLERINVLGNASQIDALLERLFAAYFQYGEDLGCRETLIAIAHACGFEAESVMDCLYGDARPFEGNHRSVNGVPSYQFDRQLKVLGAQPAEALLGAMRETLLENQRERQPA
jgi:predicted DsbA family dithiol-disulfide isomerase